MGSRSTSTLLPPVELKRRHPYVPPIIPWTAPINLTKEIPVHLPTKRPQGLPTEERMRPVRCCDCGTQRLIDIHAHHPPGWHLLHLTGRMRCTDCADALSRVNVQPYTPAYQSDPMPMPDFTPRVEATPDPTPDFSSGGGGDFAGGGASGGWGNDNT